MSTKTVRPELDALNKILTILDALDEVQRRAAVSFLAARFHPAAPNSGTEAPASGVNLGEAIQSGPPERVNTAGLALTMHANFLRFLSEYGIPQVRLEDALDIGAQSVHNLSAWEGSTNQTRGLAALLAVCQAANDGNFTVAQLVLSKAATEHGIYNQDSTATYLRRAEFEGGKVFARAGNGPWRLTPVGKKFAAAGLRRMLGLSNDDRGAPSA